MRYLLLIISIPFCFLAHAQVNRDSVTAKSTSMMKRRLGLSDSAATVMLVIGMRQVRQTDSLGMDKTVMGINRQKALVAIQQQNNTALQLLFTDDQWQQYKAIRDSTGQAFIQQMNALKIPVKKLPAGD